MSDLERLIDKHLPAARGGDRQAFAALVAGTQGMVTGLALSVVSDVQHSEDIAQEAYLRVWQRLPRLRNAESFLPWLRQITRNLARDHLRRGRVRPGDSGGTAPEDDPDRSGRGHESSEASALQEEQDRVIREALEELPADCREVLTLFYREGQSSRQVAKLLGLSDAAVRKRLQRARSGLRSRVEERLGTALLASAPGLAFTASVGGLLTAASPPATAAAALGFGAKGASKLAGAAGLGALLGLAGGIAGVVLGLRGWIRSSTDPDEMAGLLRIRRLGLVTVILAVAGLMLSTLLPGWLPATVVFVLFIAALGWQQMVMIPRVLAARHARQRALDPEAARRQLRQRRLAWLGMLLGTLSGGAGLLAGLVAAGRITLSG
ncbi:MAG: sigma-70 family RNA polymerase sigma factor [Wenzhouxiangella sp.]|jgi:RNA polymerase sigma factor (sigma-70 family)|nr:sigma-70 family RNA polymerase sigma factor [Wenzhouxiangella sp.]